MSLRVGQRNVMLLVFSLVLGYKPLGIVSFLCSPKPSISFGLSQFHFISVVFNSILVLVCCHAKRWIVCTDFKVVPSKKYARLLPFLPKFVLPLLLKFWNDWASFLIRPGLVWRKQRSSFFEIFLPMMSSNGVLGCDMVKSLFLSMIYSQPGFWLGSYWFRMLGYRKCVCVCICLISDLFLHDLHDLHDLITLLLCQGTRMLDCEDLWHVGLWGPLTEGMGMDGSPCTGEPGYSYCALRCCVFHGVWFFFVLVFLSWCFWLRCWQCVIHGVWLFVLVVVSGGFVLREVALR